MKKQTHLVFLIGITCLLWGSCAQQVVVIKNSNTVQFKEGKNNILSYQTSPKSHNGTYSRSNYIHPLYTLDGEILTEDFPEDHLHQRGIFWAWHQLYIGEQRIGDGWEIKDFSWDVQSVIEIPQKGNAKLIQSEVFWKSPLWLDEEGMEKPFVRELTTIKVYKSKRGYRQIDLEISLIALEKDVRIGGSEDAKGYGGFSPRIRLVEDTQFMGSNGIVKPENLPVEAGSWLDIAGSVGKDGAPAGMSILSHPDNPGYPNPWILRAKRSMQNAVYPYPGATPVGLSDTKPTILRYRLLIHNGELSAQEIEIIHSDYSN